MSGVRATESSELRRAYTDLDTHLDFRRNLRAVQNRRRRWRVTLHVTTQTGHATVREGFTLKYADHVPEPWQAPA